jgi:hypothetical protein
MRRGRKAESFQCNPKVAGPELFIRPGNHGFHRGNFIALHKNDMIVCFLCFADEGNPETLNPET